MSQVQFRWCEKDSAQISHQFCQQDLIEKIKDFKQGLKTGMTALLPHKSLWRFISVVTSRAHENMRKPQIFV